MINFPDLARRSSCAMPMGTGKNVHPRKGRLVRNYLDRRPLVLFKCLNCSLDYLARSLRSVWTLDVYES